MFNRTRLSAQESENGLFRYATVTYVADVCDKMISGNVGSSSCSLALNVRGSSCGGNICEASHWRNECIVPLVKSQRAGTRR